MKIYKLGDIPENLYPFIGGKARGLDLLIKNGFSVPKGFMITAIDEINEKVIYEAYDALKIEKVSVRSSASNEDNEHASNAGQFETYLFVSRDNLIESVKKCIDSLHSERVEKYNEHFSNGNNENHMNVVVQEMIDSKKAGVMFTTSPVDPTKVLIEAVEGQGENLVSGAKSATQYTPSIYKFDIKGDSLVSTKQLEELYNISKRVKEVFHAEMDLEWAINGKLYLLQMRPITVDTYDLREFDRTDDVSTHVFTKRNVGEMMPGAVTPLTYSTSTYAIDYGMRYMMKKAGLIKRIDDQAPLRMITSWSGHLFFDMNLLYNMHARVAIASNQQMNLSIMGEKYDHCVVEMKYANNFVRFINSIKFMMFVFSGGRARKKLNKLVNKTKFTVNSGIKEIYDEIDYKLRYLNKALIYHYAASSDSGSASSTLYQMLEKEFKDKNEYQAFLASLLTNIPNIESADILKRLQDIADKCKEINPEVVNYSEEELLKFIKENDNDDLKNQYSEFIRIHGHRCIKEAEMRSKAWKNDELSLMTYLKSILMSPKSLTQGGEDINLKEKFKFIKKCLLRKFAIIFAKRSRKAVVYREYTKSRMIKMIDLFKDQYILLAKLMVKDGLLEDEDQIYFLTHEEIKKVIDGDTSLAKKALVRRKTFEYQQELTFDDTYIGMPIPNLSNDDDTSGDLKGVPVCLGEIEGIVRVVNSVEDAKKLHKGEIMVAKFTDIGWSPYYSNISGLITEIGSSLSHGAVVAREYNLPTVVNVKNATKRLKTGDKIRLNATKGLINVI